MITIKNQGYISLHVTEIKDLHYMYFTSFYVTFHVILCCISYHFMLYFTHFIIRITYIARISRMSHISHFTNSAYCMHCTAYHVILCIISCHFIMKIHSILIHGTPHWREKKKGQNATLFNRAPAKWGVLIRWIKMPLEWGIFQTIKAPPRAGVLSVWCNFARESHFSRRPLVAFH